VKTYPIELEGFEGQTIEVQPAGFVSGAKLIVNGQPAPKGPHGGQMLLRRNDGREVVATWKPTFLDMPKLNVDGKTYEVARALKWYEWLWCGLPVLLVLTGGALGVFFGLIGLGINTQIFRGETHLAAKYIFTGVVSLATAIVYFFLAFMLISILPS
jgi:hypothetical protein